jgi:DNA polymerase-3 subunit alpha
MIPEGVKVTLETAKNEVREFRQLEHDEDPSIRKLMHYAQVLEGSARHTGVHAAGVIIAPGNVSDYVPVAVARSKGDEVVTTQYDGNWVEAFGLLKMDFLGLKTLTVMNDAMRLIEEEHGRSIDLEDIPLDDEKTFELFQRGDTVAIFQFESTGMREWLRKLKPTGLDDLIAMNALYRPGPMDLIPNYVDRKHRREPVEYPHPMLEPVLKPTYGIPVYQEQVMQMAQIMGGYSLGRADLLRRAMGKKKQSEMDRQRAVFVAGATERGVTEAVADDVFDMMAKFAGYGFTKSHSAAYSLVAYQTAYLKAHFPAAFMAAAMTNEMGDTKRLSVVLEEARQMGVEVLPPSINGSRNPFTVDGGRIRFGLGAIKGVGSAAIEAIVAAREKHGAFKTVFDLTRELDLRAVNKKTLESLARAGALDDLEGHRAEQVEAVDLAVQYAQRVQADRAAGQNSLFGEESGGALSLPSLPEADRWPRSRMLKEERDLMGFYISGHPLEAYAAEARAFATAELGTFSEDDPGQADASHENGTNGRGPNHSFFGIITEVQRRTTKSGKPIAFASIEDFTGQGEIVCFSNVFDRVQNYLQVDEIVMVSGEVERRGGSVKIIGRDVVPMWKVREQMVKAIVLNVDSDHVEAATIDEIRNLCENNRGQCKLYFDIHASDQPGGPQRVRSRSFVVDPTPELMNGVARLLGRGNVLLEGE